MENELTNEEKFTASSLIEEIEPLLKSYFVSSVDYVGNEITMSFYNGQKFTLTAKEI